MGKAWSYNLTITGFLARGAAPERNPDPGVDALISAVQQGLVENNIPPQPPMEAHVTVTQS